MYERIWTYDLETVANERSDDYYSTKTYYPAANLKDPAKIEASIAAKKAADMKKSALHWWTAQIVCISVVEETGKAHVFYGVDEAKVLGDFFELLTVASQSCALPITLIGKESKNFDFPMVVGRCLATKTVPHNIFKRDRPLSDINDIFGFSKSQCDQIGKLDDYAWGMNYPQKTSHGKKVGEMYNKACMGDDTAWEEMKEYCIHDSMIVHEMAKRYYGELISEPIRVSSRVSETISEIPFGG